MIFVTGSSGFVGQNLLRYLRGKDLTPLHREQLHSITQNELSGCEVIVHLAGKAHDIKRSLKSAEYYEVNYELTKKLYDAFIQSDASKFIFISSVKAAADVVKGVLNEDDIPSPVTDYGKSKLKAEQYIINCIIPPGKSYYILRPCMIHGPGNKGNLNLLYKFVQKGIPYPLASFENKRSFLSVENLCFVISNLLEKEIPSGVYNVADDDPLSTNEVVKILAGSLNKKPKLWAISTKLIRALAKIGDVFKFPLNTDRLDKLTENYVVSNKKIKGALEVGMPLSVIDGLKVTASSFNLSKLSEAKTTK